MKSELNSLRQNRGGSARIVDVVSKLQDYGIAVVLHDLLATPEEAHARYMLDPVAEPEAVVANNCLDLIAHALGVDPGGEVIALEQLCGHPARRYGRWRATGAGGTGSGYPKH